MNSNPILLAGCAILALMAALSPAAATGQERITLLEPGDDTSHQFQGQIVRWDATELVYVSNGRELRVPARRVAAVEYARLPDHEEGDRYRTAGRPDQAAARYDRAMAEEKRDWVLEDIRAGRLWCATAIGDTARAISEFRELLRINMDSRYFGLMPLAWQQTDRAPAAMTDNLQRWLDGQDEVGALIAASWLFNADQPRALKRLRQLATGAGPRIARLAEAQCWRAETLTATGNELNRWELAITRMPEADQAGPRFLAAMVKLRIQGDGQAIVAALQIPILYPEHYQLCGGALVMAHQALQKAGRHREAELVASELDRSYGFSTAAARFRNPGQTIDP